MKRDVNRRIDWEKVHADLKRSDAALNAALFGTSELAGRILKDRARRLALRCEGTGKAKPELTMMAFRMGKERYCIDLKELAEVLPYAGCTLIPGSPPYVLGVVNLRGEIRPVLSFSALLGVPQENGEAAGVAAFLRGQGREIGLRLDAMDGVVSLSEDEAERPLDASAIVSSPHLRGLTSDGVGILNADSIRGLEIFRDIVAERGQLI